MLAREGVGEESGERLGGDWQLRTTDAAFRDGGSGGTRSRRSTEW